MAKFSERVRKEIAAIARQQQKLRSILKEQGVELEPESPPSLNVLPGISRTWATVWGRNGSSLQIVQVDGVGQIVTRPPRFDLCETIIKPTAFTGIHEAKTINFEKAVDFVHIACLGNYFWAEFSSDGTKWRNRRYAIPVYGPTEPFWTQLELFTRCQHVKVYSLYFANASSFDIIGEVFPTT